MEATQRDRVGDVTLRCARCGEVIGVYEPLVHLVGGIAQTTSRAANPDIIHARPVYHAACIAPADTEPADD